jgi:outer membrane receptor protein involved in Fe transport
MSRIPCRMYRSAAVLLACTVLFAGTPAHAQEKDVTDMTLMELLSTKISVASTKAENVLKTVSTVSVIDQRMIKDFNFRTVSEAVNTVSGVEVLRTSFMNTIPMVRGVLQAHYANKTLILLNGIPSWFTATGEGFLDRVDINDVERIEVLKGPASVLYGSNAYSGVVNIVLKERQDEGESFSMHGSLGTEKVFAAGGNYTSNHNGRQLFLSANASNEEGNRLMYLDSAGENGEVTDRRYPVGGNFTLISRDKENALTLNAYKDVFTDLEGSDPKWSAGAGKPHERDGYLANYMFTKTLCNLIDIKYNLTYDWNSREFDRTRDGSLFTKSDGYRANTNLVADFHLSDRFNFELGAEYEYRYVDYYLNYNPAAGQNQVLTYSNIKDRHVYEYSSFGQLGYTSEKVNATVGSRWTKNELFGDNLSSRGTVVYSINDKNSLKLIAGQSFRAPSMFELFVLSASRKTQGTTDLKPETGDSAELAYLTSFGKTFLQVTGYHDNFYDRIERVTLPSYTYPDGVTILGVSKYTNGANFLSNGVELEVKYVNPALFDAFVNGSCIASNDQGDAVNFRYVPDYFGAAGIARDFGKFFASGLVHYLSNIDGRLAPINAYTWGDISFGFKDGRVKHIISVENVTDEPVYFPEYVWKTGTLDRVPAPYGRRIVYTFNVRF